MYNIIDVVMSDASFCQTSSVMVTFEVVITRLTNTTVDVSSQRGNFSGSNPQRTVRTCSYFIFSGENVVYFRQYLCDELLFLLLLNDPHCTAVYM